MRFVFIVIMVSIFINCTEKLTNNQLQDSYFNVKSISPSKGGFIPDSGGIRVTFEYSIADKDTSPRGYNILIGLQSADLNGYTVTPSEMYHITQRSGTTEIYWPIANVKKFTGLKYPLTCIFILENITSDYANYNICQTDEYYFEYNM
jgi:hypothetical protein